MKKGFAGVRLCDTPGCYDRWPCDRHGTLMVGRPLAPPRAPLPGAALVRVGDTVWGNELADDIKDDIKCLFCGYAVCSCPKTPTAELLEQTRERLRQTTEAVAPLQTLRCQESLEGESVPEGWEKTTKGYIHQTLPLAVRPRRDGNWQWRAGADDSSYQTGVCKTQYLAMEKAEEVYEEEEAEDWPLGWMLQECGCCWKGPNDAIVSEEDGQYRYAVILPTGGRTSLASSPAYAALEEACAAAERAAANYRAMVEITREPLQHQTAGSSSMVFYTLGVSDGTAGWTPT